MPRLLNIGISRWLTACLLLTCLVGNKIFAQTSDYIYGYQITTGVDTSQWIHCDTWDNATLYGYGAISSYDIGFDFDFWGQLIRDITVSPSGSVYLGTAYYQEYLYYRQHPLACCSKSSRGQEVLDHDSSRDRRHRYLRV